MAKDIVRGEIVGSTPTRAEVRARLKLLEAFADYDEKIERAKDELRWVLGEEE